MAQAINSVRLNEILIELDQLSDEIEGIKDEQDDTGIEYELSECISSLVDAITMLRKALTHYSPQEQ